MNKIFVFVLLALTLVCSCTNSNDTNWALVDPDYFGVEDITNDTENDVSVVLVGRPVESGIKDTLVVKKGETVNRAMIVWSSDHVESFRICSKTIIIFKDDNNTIVNTISMDGPLSPRDSNTEEVVVSVAKNTYAKMTKYYYHYYISDYI